MIRNSYPGLPLGGKNIISHFTARNASFPVHKSTLSIKCTLSGSENYIVSGNNYLLDASCYLVTNEGSACSGKIESESDVESLSVFFGKDFVKDVFIDLFSSPLAPGYFPSDGNIFNPDKPFSFFENLYPHDTHVSPVLLKIRTASQRGFNDNEWLNEQLYLLLENLVKVNGRIFELIRKLPPVKLSTKVEIYKRAHRAKDFIDANFCSDITIESIAKEACLSEFHFLRSFKTIFKKTPRQYIINKRLERAMDLFRFTGKSVTEVCYEIGFSSPGTFSWLFRKKFGLYPENMKNSYQFFLTRIAGIKA